MNNSVNYSNFIDLLIASDDDYEPYGLSIHSNSIGLSESEYELEMMQASLFSDTTKQRYGE